jgi:hypothetical protein
VQGCNSALAASSVEEVVEAVSSHPFRLRGFHAEGAAMGAAFRTLFLPGRRELPRLLAALAEKYVHLTHVGVGWAIARVPFARSVFERALDPGLAPLAIDGRGFHDGYFASPAEGFRSWAVGGDASAVYHQGIGRSLWFSTGADVERIATAIDAREERYHGDLWAGIGLASVYAGGVDPSSIGRLASRAGRNRTWLRQGAAFAIAAYARAGQVPDDAAANAQLITDARPEQLTDIVAACYAAVDSRLPALHRYRLWREGIAVRLSDGAAR